ncbi:hypothetical protein ACOSQ2_013137 [Xanthoceras sorbifolium]
MLAGSRTKEGHRGFLAKEVPHRCSQVLDQRRLSDASRFLDKEGPRGFSGSWPKRFSWSCQTHVILTLREKEDMSTYHVVI